MDKLNKELRSKAISYGLCKGWTQDWSENRNKQELIEMWLRGIDFAIQHNYPTNEFIKENFSSELLKVNNVFVDCPVGGVNLTHKAVICGDCKGALVFDGFSSCDIYVRHTSKIHIDALKFSKIFVNLYDDAEVTIKQKDIAKVYVYLHGSNCRVKYEGEVLVRESRG